MILTIARKEFTEIRRDGRFIWTGLVILVLLITAVAVGAQRYSENSELRLAAERSDRENWLNQGSRNPHSAGHSGVYAFKPATPLSLFDPGYDDYTGVLQYLVAHQENQSAYKPAADGTSLQRFGELSGARILQLLVPLLIFIVAFGLIAVEREDGTYRQTLSLGVPQTRLVLGKALGAMAAIFVILIPALILGAILSAGSWSGSDEHAMVGFVSKLILLSTSYIMFFTTLICIALIVSLIARSSAAALVGLIGFWILCALLVPRFAGDLAQAIYPTPSVFELTKEIESDRSEGIHPHEPNHPNHIKFRDALLARYDARSLEELPFNFIGYAMQVEEEFGNEVFDKHYGAVRDQYKRQAEFYDWFAMISPFIAIKSLSTAYSGTDVEFANDFSRSAEEYRREMVRVLNYNIMHNAGARTTFSTEWGYSAGPELWKQIPPFDFDPPLASTVTQRKIIPFAILLGWLLVAIIVLRTLARRMPRVQ